jgi:hypothetical protein
MIYATEAAIEIRNRVTKSSLIACKRNARAIRNHGPNASANQVLGLRIALYLSLGNSFMRKIKKILVAKDIFKN